MNSTYAGLSKVEIACLATSGALDLELTGTEEEREKQVLDYLLPLFTPYIDKNGLAYDGWDYTEKSTDNELRLILKCDIFPTGCRALSSFDSLTEWAKNNGWKALVWVCLSTNEGTSHTSQPMWC